MALSRLLLVRHAEVEPAYQHLFGGRIDMGLSARGHAQAAALAGYLTRQPLAGIYASPMKRVQQTLAPCLLDGVPRPVTLPALQEVDFGIWTGLGWNEVRTRFGVSAFDWLEQLERGAIPQAESGATLRARIEPCLRQILRDHPGQQVAVVCHGGVIRVILGLLLDLPLSKTGVFEVDYASVTRVCVRPEQTALELLNFTPWREAT